jgi:hypothetical protein
MTRQSRKKAASAIAPAAWKPKLLRRLSGLLYVNRSRPEPRYFTALNPMRLKPAFSALDRVSPVPAADLWAVRSEPAVSVALAGSVGLQLAAPEWASADRYVADCDFLDLTFLFLLFAGLSVVGKSLRSC